MDTAKLEKIAAQMMARPGGILAADESPSTMGKRLSTIGMENTTENRKAWRHVMFGAKLLPYVNAVILPEEILQDSALVGLLAGQSVLPGVKIDGGLAKFGDSDIEEVTLGLDGVDGRLAEYVKLGATFTKFRSFLHIDTARNLPSAANIRENARVQAAFALATQKAGLVPMVEPEVDMVGLHSIDDCESVTRETLKVVFEELAAAGVHYPGMVLKPNMVLSGKDASNRASTASVAERTVAVLTELVPPFVAGIAFLSGGQADAEAYANLNEINRVAAAKGNRMRFTFSFGRAAQDSARKVWNGQAANETASREAFIRGLREMSEASTGSLVTAG
jgi:fructose-bisphosphate aldolase class I